jgi:RHS repeat-associated protein
MSGNTRHDTNYIYDDFGNLSFILMPIASDVLTANQTYNIWGTYSNICLAGYVYLFNHDYRNRLDTKIVPGGTMEPYVYDKADRLVMTQTPAIQIPGGDGDRGWLFNKYDALGRVVLSGIYHGDDYTSNDVNLRVCLMRELFKNIVSRESPANDPGNYYYTWNTFPSASTSQVTKANYYDDYTYATGGDNQLAYQAKTGYGTPYTSAKGLLTGTWDKLLDSSGWIRTTYYYDAFGNVIQKRSTNQKGGYDYEYYAYNYNNQVTKKLTEHQVSGQTLVTEEYSYTYDTQLRLTKVNYKLNNGTGVDIAEYKYNELGQVIEKKTGGARETAAIQYNIRGWLTAQTGQRFSENLYYTTNPKSGGAKYFGGNVSALTWKAEPIATTVRGYSFQYNPLGWLTGAAYGEGTALNTNTLRYDESFTYDKAGNIAILKRYGMRDNNTFGLIDDLNITHLGLRIHSVYDAITVNQSSSDVMEFKMSNAPLNAGLYMYYAGALTNDYHKRICMIKYNHLTLPQSVQFSYGNRIEYVYDAAGVKRKTMHKVTFQNKNYGFWSLDEPAPADFDNSKTVTTEYIGNKVYVNNQLKHILTEEGYMERQSNNTYTAHYYLRDRLGNNRIVMDAAGTVKQVNNYYPSGTSMAERRTDQGIQPYKFGDKELDRTNGLDFYDFEARAYDPVLMRFTRPDPLAELKPWLTPYHYASNNPVSRVDPTGLIDYEIQKTGYIYDSSSWWDKVKRLWNGPDETDRLIASNGQMLTMPAGTMTNFTDKKDADGKTSGQTFQVNDRDAAEQIHEFLSENVRNVEYGVVDAAKSGVESSTVTSLFPKKGEVFLRNDASTVAWNLIQSGADVTRITHNHPPDYQQVPSPEDRGAIVFLNSVSPNNSIKHRIYRPQTKTYLVAP